jgi:hypothetical protein
MIFFGGKKARAEREVQVRAQAERDQQIRLLARLTIENYELIPVMLKFSQRTLLLLLRLSPEYPEKNHDELICSTDLEQLEGFVRDAAVQSAELRKHFEIE